MTCKVVRTCLLGLEQPDQPPPDAASHLAACGACREWHRRLIQLERSVPLLPVPASSAKSRVIARILTEPPARPTPHEKPAPRQPGWVERERRLKKLAIAAALSAALLLVAVGLWAWRVAHDTPSAPTPRPAATEDPLLARLMQRNLNLASARTPRQRVETLADVADDLHSEARSLIDVADGIVKQAKALPAGERAAVLGIAGRLKRMCDEANQLADLVPDRADPLRQIAAAAHDGDLQLRELMREEKS